jgi:hypothetical protein
MNEPRQILSPLLLHYYLLSTNNFPNPSPLPINTNIYPKHNHGLR